MPAAILDKLNLISNDLEATVAIYRQLDPDGLVVGLMSSAGEDHRSPPTF